MRALSLVLATTFVVAQAAGSASQPTAQPGGQDAAVRESYPSPAAPNRPFPAQTLRIYYVYTPLFPPQAAAVLPTNFTVAAYLPEWRYDGANYARLCRVVTHLIFFSIEVLDDLLSSSPPVSHSPPPAPHRHPTHLLLSPGMSRCERTASWAPSTGCRCARPVRHGHAVLPDCQ